MKLRENSACQVSINKSLHLRFACSLSLWACFLWFSFRYGVWNIHVKGNLSKTFQDVVQTKNSSVSESFFYVLAP